MKFDRFIAYLLVIPFIVWAIVFVVIGYLVKEWRMIK